jgi:Protein of unknown function (DUF2950)
MESHVIKTVKWKQIALISGLALASLAAVAVKLTTRNSAFAEGAQMTFRSPAEAGAALASGTKAGDEEVLSRILGVEAKSLLITGEKKADQEAMEGFTAKYEKMNRWVEMTDGTRVLYIGADNFAFPVPLVKNPSGRWYFDAVGGAQEVKARDIGRNELLAIDACAALANAQEIYVATVGPAPEYAQRIVSTPGKRDGLYWPASQTQATSPLGALDEFPQTSLGSIQEPLSIDGYTMRILTSQGDAAPGGAESYIVDGKMTGGFAILATPVKYGETGIMSFMTGDNGVVYERDLGPNTATVATSIREYNPDQSWLPVD